MQDYIIHWFLKSILFYVFLEFSLHFFQYFNYFLKLNFFINDIIRCVIIRIRSVLLFTCRNEDIFQSLIKLIVA
jgi:hypothetical protein